MPLYTIKIVILLPKTSPHSVHDRKYWGSALLISALLGPAVSFHSVYLFHLVLSLITIQILSNKERRTELISEVKKPSNLLLLFTWVWFGISLIWAENKFLGITYVIQLTVGLLLVFLIPFFIRSKDDFSFYQRKILLPVLWVVLFISLLEIYTDFRWPISMLSNNNALLGQDNLVDSLLKKELIPGYLMSSPTSFFWNPNNLAFALCFFLPFTLRFHWKNYVLFCIMLLVIIQTGSRLTMIAVFLGLILSALIKKQNFRFLLLYLGMLLLPLVFLAKTNWAYKSNEVVETMTRQNLLYSICLSCPEKPALAESSHSTQIRKQLLHQGVDYIQQSRFLGLGAGNAVWFNEKQKEKTQQITAVHFYWLELIINGGIVIAGLFFIYFFQLYKKLWINRGVFEGRSLLIGLFICTLAVVSLSSAHYFLPFWGFLGMVSAVLEILQNNEENSFTR